MSGMERYGNRKMPKIISEWRALADACRAEGTPAIQEALDRVEPVIDAAFQGDAAVRAAREDALREAADRIRKIAAGDPAIALGAATAAAMCDAMIDGEKP